MKSFFTKVRNYCLANIVLRGKLDSFSDEKVLKFIYWFSLGKKPDTQNPVTYTEKMQWLKLNDRKDIYTSMVDKRAAKDFISERIGDEHIIPALGVWEHFSEIDFDKLPDSFVLKCTHDSGSCIICKSKQDFDKEKYSAYFEERLHRNYYFNYREWPYKNIPPQIIAEPLIHSRDAEFLTDYKFFCFNGNPQFVFITQENSKLPYADIFDMEFNRVPFSLGDPTSDSVISRPTHFEEMRDMAVKLSAGIPHLRVDFYVVDDIVYVGELTFFHSAGFPKIEPPEWDEIIGSWLNLPNSSIKK